jgi:hypothetical protein
MRGGGAPLNMKMWLLNWHPCIGYQFVYDRPPLSLRSQMVDLLTTGSLGSLQIAGRGGVGLRARFVSEQNHLIFRTSQLD